MNAGEILINVDLPAALSPTRPSTSSAPIVKVAWERARTAPNAFEMSVIETSGVLIRSPRHAAPIARLRRLTIVLSRTAEISTIPVTTCTQYGSTSSRLRPLRMELMKSAPITVPDHRGGSTERARAAEDDGGNGVELEAHARVRRAVR